MSTATKCPQPADQKLVSNKSETSVTNKVETKISNVKLSVKTTTGILVACSWPNHRLRYKSLLDEYI